MVSRDTVGEKEEEMMILLYHQGDVRLAAYIAVDLRIIRSAPNRRNTPASPILPHLPW